MASQLSINEIPLIPVVFTRLFPSDFWPRSLGRVWEPVTKLIRTCRVWLWRATTIDSATTYVTTKGEAWINWRRNHVTCRSHFSGLVSLHAKSLTFQEHRKDFWSGPTVMSAHEAWAQFLNISMMNFIILLKKWSVRTSRTGSNAYVFRH